MLETSDETAGPQACRADGESRQPVLRSAAIDLGGDAFRERVGSREKWMVPGVELDNTSAGLYPLALSVGRNREVVGADEVGSGLLPPRDLPGRLGEGDERLPGEAVDRLLDGRLVTVLVKVAHFEATPGANSGSRIKEELDDGPVPEIKDRIS